MAIRIESRHFHSRGVDARTVADHPFLWLLLLANDACWSGRVVQLPSADSFALALSPPSDARHTGRQLCQAGKRTSTLCPRSRACFKGGGRRGREPIAVKADAEAIRAFIRDLTHKPWLVATNHAHWPSFLFRVDDVRAAASILERGALCSRNRASALGLLQHDSASRGVIEHSPDWIKDCVRLYFRPRTPTEFRSEGFRPP